MIAKTRAMLRSLRPHKLITQIKYPAYQPPFSQQRLLTLLPDRYKQCKSNPNKLYEMKKSLIGIALIISSTIFPDWGKEFH